MKAKVKYGLIEEGLYIGRPAIFLKFGEGEDLNINEIAEEITNLEQLHKCKRLMIDETKEKRHLELIKILIALQWLGLEAYLLTDCKLITHYNLRDCIKEYHVKIIDGGNISDDAMMFFSGTKNSYFYYYVSKNLMIEAIKGWLPDKKLLLMPKGKTFKEYKSNLKKAAKWCKKHGYILGTRIDLFLKNDKSK